MKKIFAVILMVFICMGALPASAYGDEAFLIMYDGEVVCEGIVFEDDFATYYPLAPVMRALGYTVSFEGETQTVSAVKGSTAYYFEIPPAIVYSVTDGKEASITLFRAPFIKDGVTYVDGSFFSYALKEASYSDYSTEYEGDKYKYTNYIVFYDLAPQAQRLMDLFRAALSKQAEYGFDAKNQETGLYMDFAMSVVCDTLGISVTGGGECKMGVYIDDRLTSVSYTVDTQGILNLMNLVSTISGTKPDFEEIKTFDMVAADGDTYVRSDAFNGIMPEGSEGKWAKQEGGQSLDFDDIATYEGILKATSSSTYNGAEKIAMADAFVDMCEKLFEQIEYTEKDGKTYIISDIDAAELKEIVLSVFGKVVVGYYHSDRDEALANQVAAVESLFSAAEVLIKSECEIENGKIIKNDSVVDLKFEYVFDEIGLPVTFSLSATSGLSEEYPEPAKEIPAENVVYLPSRY